MKNLSIITINYNNCKGLETTIKSVLSQTYDDFEYIVIDGGSNDGSVEVIKKYGGRITYWVSEKDLGIYNAMNKGLHKAIGEYCMIINSGDYFYSSDTTEKLFASKVTEDIVYGDIQRKWGDGKITYDGMPEKLTFYYLLTNNIWHPATLIKNSLYRRYGYYNEEYKIAADYAFFLDMIIVKQVTTRYINLPIVIYAMDGLSSQPHNFDLINVERKKAQESLIPSKYLEAGCELVSLKNSGDMDLIKWLNKHSVMKKLLSGFIRILHNFK